MFPFFQIFGIEIYTFGITLTICFFAFLYGIKYLSQRFGYNPGFFFNNIIWYFLSVFIFSRLFFVISRWDDLKFIKDPFEFFIMSNYNFSLFWAIFGFLLVAFINIKIEKSSMRKYIDGLTLSFLFVLFLGFVWALLGGQVYGRETTFGIEILYSHPFTLVPYQVPIFPLPIVYAITSFLLFSVLYILSALIHIRGLIGYLGLLVFSATVLILESFSGRFDILSAYVFFNLNQVYALVVAGWAMYELWKLYIVDNMQNEVINPEK